MAKKSTATAVATENSGYKKTVCSITREQFNKDAKPLMLTASLPGVGEQRFILEPKNFATGSIGWRNGERTVLVIDGVPTKCITNLLITVVGSKELPK